MSQLNLFGLQESSELMYLSAASPASLTALPDGAKAEPTNETSGLISHESRRRSDPAGQFLRTWLASELQWRTNASLTWNRSATPLGRSWWVLGLSARHTKESESGLWATPMTTDAQGVPYQQTATHKYPRLTGQVTGTNTQPERREQRATPRAEGSAGSTGVEYEPGKKPRRNGKTSTTTLIDQVRVVNWPTPDTVDDGTGAVNQGSNKKNTPKNFLEALNWPTPNVPNGGRSPKPGSMSLTGMTRGGKKRQVDLQYAVREQESASWPTPAARDWKDSGHEPSAQERKSPCLPASVILNGDGPLDTDSPNTSGNRPASLRLNPAWVETLMGLPEGWTDVDDESG